MIRHEIVGDKEVVAHLMAFPPSLREELKREVSKQTLLLKAHVVEQKLSGQVLKRRTGTLAGSIGVELSDTAGGVIGRVGTLNKAVKYARLHEYGGRTEPHEIVAKGKALRFQLANGAILFRKSVMHPGSRMPERSFLRSSLSERRSSIQTGMDSAVTRAKK